MKRIKQHLYWHAFFPVYIVNYLLPSLLQQHLLTKSYGKTKYHSLKLIFYIDTGYWVFILFQKFVLVFKRRAVVKIIVISVLISGSPASADARFFFTEDKANIWLPSEEFWLFLDKYSAKLSIHLTKIKAALTKQTHCESIAGTYF